MNSSVIKSVRLTAFKLLSPTLRSLSNRLATSKVSIALYRSVYLGEDELLIHFRLVAVALQCQTCSLLSILSLSAMIQSTQRNSVICYYIFGNSFVLERCPNSYPLVRDVIVIANHITFYPLLLLLFKVMPSLYVATSLELCDCWSSNPTV